MIAKSSRPKILWCPYAQRGALYPVMPAVSALIDAGADLLTVGPASLGDFAVSQGLRFMRYNSDLNYDWSNQAGVDPRSRGPSGDRSWFGRRTETEFGDTITAVAEFEPDIMLVDSLFVGGGLAAEASGVPWASYVHYMFDERATTDDLYRNWWHRPGTDDVDTFIAWWNGLRRQVGLDPDARTTAEALWYRMSPRLTLMLTHPELRRSGQPVPGYVVRAHLPPWNDPATTRDPDPWQASGTRPRLLLANSAAWQQDADFIELTIDALRDEDIEVVVTVAASHHIRMNNPGNVTLLGYYPHSELIPLADAIMTTAGAGAVGKALWFGKPVVVAPIARDTHLIAEAVEECGLGKVINPIAPETIVRAANQVLSDNDIRNRVRSIAGPRPEYPGAEQVAKMILNLCRTSRQPEVDVRG
jgi:UDP:flavonoid glycosyltransferase YjiC (YdhE family)